MSVYFGKMPNHFNLLLESIRKNPTVDFIIFTDQKLISRIKNLRYIHITLKQLDTRIKQKLSPDFMLNTPYKCCDYKPVYGIIFDDYIKDYDFWGHCDLDLIFGDIRKFITDDILNKYDKILPLGHLSLYRNNIIVNNRYTSNGATCGNYQKVFSSNKHFAFDEWRGIMAIYYKNKFPFYDKRVFADISILRKRFTLALNDKNYKQQVFYWEDGHIYRAFEEDNDILRNEFMYIHFKQRKYLRNLVKEQKFRSYYICDKGFIDKKVGLPSRKDITKYNKYHGVIIENTEIAFNIIKLYLNKFKKKILNVR